MENKPKTIARQVYDSEVEFFGNLYCRWLDEQEYEDIADYKAVIQARIPQMEIVKMHKQPFGFTAKAQGKTYRFAVTMKNYSYKQIA